MDKTRINTQKLIDFTAQKFENGELDNHSLVQLIELCGTYLNLQTIPTYAQNQKLTYNGAKKPTKTRTIKELFGVKFVIDND